MTKVEPIMGLIYHYKALLFQDRHVILHLINQPVLYKDSKGHYNSEGHEFEYDDITRLYCVQSCPYNSEDHECEYDIIIDPSPCALSLCLVPILCRFLILVGFG